jgi:chromosome segregation ATPase
MVDEEQRTEALEAAAEKRIELKHALSGAETAAAAPLSSPDWSETLLAALRELQEALYQHVEEVEAEDGLLTELTQTAPRLVNQISRIKDEHPVLCRQVAEAIGRLEGQAAATGTIRDEVTDLLMAVVRHRQRGADLVYEGYHVDIGGWR